MFDKLADTLLDRQVQRARDVDLITDWDRYVPWIPGETGEGLIGAYWDPEWYAPSSPGRIRFIDTLSVLQYADVMSYVYAKPGSTHFRDRVTMASIINALSYAARRIESGRPITNRCFDFGQQRFVRDVVQVDNVHGVFPAGPR